VSPESGFKLDKGGHTWSPKDHNFPGRSMAMWFFDGLIEACDKAGYKFDENDLSTFIGLRVSVENREYNTKVRGTSINREKPYVTGILETGVAVSTSAATPKKKATTKKATPKAPNGGSLDELSGTLTKLLDANDGEMEVDAITAKALKGVVDGDYPTRKALAMALVEEDFLGTQEVASLDDGVLSAN
jgi:hypothetical protein